MGSGMNKRITALFMAFSMMFILVKVERLTGKILPHVTTRFIDKKSCVAVKHALNKSNNSPTKGEYLECVSAKDYIPPNK